MQTLKKHFVVLNDSLSKANLPDNHAKYIMDTGRNKLFISY